MANTPEATVDFPTRDAARVRVVRSALGRHGEWVVFAAVLVLGALAALVLRRVDPSALVYFGDAASHLVASRKLADWGDNPGLARFGTVWLPLPHLLLLPFTFSIWLFGTGLSGLAISLPSLALTATLLYKIVRNQFGGPAYLAAAGGLLYALNPNVLYLGLVAMTEAPFMLFFVGAAYAFQRWYCAPERLRLLAASALLVVLATLCRYEGWVLPLFLTVAVALRAAGADLSTRRRDACVVLALLSTTGIALWLMYNAYQYGDALQFANADFYSAAAQALTRDNREKLLLQPVNVLGIYGAIAFFVYGPILLSTAALGLMQLRREREHSGVRVGPLLAFLAMPPLFTLVALLVGIGEMSFWFNSRFLVLLSPLLILLSAALVLSLHWGARRVRRLVLAVMAAWAVGTALMIGLDKVPVYLDARGGFGYQVNPFTVQTGEALASVYDGGKIVILTGSAQEHRIMLTAGVPLGQYEEILTSSTWKPSYEEPWRYGRWLVLSKAPDSDAVSAADAWKARRGELDEHYDRAYENEYYEILRRRET